MGFYHHFFNTFLEAVSAALETLSKNHCQAVGQSSHQSVGWLRGWLRGRTIYILIV